MSILITKILLFLYSYKYIILFIFGVMDFKVASIFAGFMLSAKNFSLPLIYLVLILGNIIPDAIFYFIGRFGGEMKIVKKNKDKFSSLQKLWELHPNTALILCKFASFFSIPLVISAGLVKLPYKKMISKSVLIDSILIAIFVLAGYFSGNLYKSYSIYLGYLGLTLAILFIFFILIFKYLNIENLNIESLNIKNIVFSLKKSFQNNKKKFILNFLFLLLILIGIFYFFENSDLSFLNSKNKIELQNSITKSLSDNIINTDNTDLLDGEYGNFTFKYPKDLATKFIHTVDWPPIFSVDENPFSCTVYQGLEVSAGGQTNKEIIGDKEFCVTKESEGAAGSVYTSYIYKSDFQGKTLVVNFTLRSPQCMNYDNPTQTECITEEKDFNISLIINSIISSIKFK